MRVALACDLLREQAGAGFAERNSEWLWPIVQPMLAATGIQVVLHTLGDPATAEAATGAMAGLDPQTAWPRLYSDPTLLGAVRETCRPLLDCDLVIGHELSPNQLRVLEQAGRPLLDLSIDALRFASDLFLRARTTDARLGRLLREHHTRQDAVRQAAIKLRARAEKAIALPGPAVLFIGQTERDASLIQGFRLRSVAEFMDQVHSLLRPGDHFLLKPHPYADTSGDILSLHDAVHGSTIVQDNVYALVCSPAVRLLITLSSSVAAEARVLGLPVYKILEPDRDTGPPRMVTGRLAVRGLQAVLASYLTSGRPTRLQARSATLRKAVGQDWGYTDRPRLCRRSVSEGQSLEYGEGGLGIDLCTLGWSAPEHDGRWTDGPLALLLLHPLTPGLFLSLKLSAFVPRGSGPVSLTISSGVNRSKTMRFRTRRPRRVLIRLPPASGPVELRFDVSGVSSPAEHGLSGDRRMLGIKLRQTTLRRTSAVSAIVTRASRTAVCCANLAVQLAFVIAGLT